MTNQPDISTIPAEHLPWMVAGAWKLCYRCGGDGFLRMTEPPCSVCSGTGRIYALPETVRVPCRQVHNLIEVTYNQRNASSYARNATCTEKGCPGFQPSTDLAVWIDALDKARWAWRTAWNHHWEIWHSDGPVHKFFDHEEGATHLLSLQRALAQALVAEGRTLGEVA